MSSVCDLLRLRCLQNLNGKYSKELDIQVEPRLPAWLEIGSLSHQHLWYLKLWKTGHWSRGCSERRNWPEQNLENEDTTSQRAL
jgi:hypothetical protein